MKKIFLFLFFLSILGCKKHNSNPDNQSVEKIDFFLKKTLNNKYSEKEQLIYNDKALELLMNIENSAFKRKSMDLVIDNYFFLNQWDKYNKISRELLDISKSANDSNYIAKAMRYQGNYYYKEKVLDSSFYFYNKSEFFFKNIKDYNSYSVERPRNSK